MVSSAVTWCGGASSSRAPSSMPAGYASQTGYQYDSISRVAGQREPAPPSNCSKLGGFIKSVFITDGMRSPFGLPLQWRVFVLPLHGAIIYERAGSTYQLSEYASHGSPISTLPNHPQT